MLGLNESKLKSLAHYICWKCQDPATLGAVKLNKVLWFADTTAFIMWGKPITEATYVKQQFGPVPSSIYAALHELVTERKLVIRDMPHFGKAKREFIALVSADISMFSPEEISLVDEVIHEICNNHTATSISEASHDRIWELAEIGETIPYQAVLASELGEITDADLAWAREKMTGVA